MSWSVKKIVIPFLAAFIFVLLAGFIILISLIRHQVVTSIPYQETLHWIGSNPEVIQQIGEVKRFGYFPHGIFNSQKESHEASITMPLIGKTRKAKIRTNFVKEGEKWKMLRAEITKDKNGDWISLLPLEVAPPVFPEGSNLFESGEGISWEIEVKQVQNKNGEIHIREGITVMNEIDQMVVQEPQFMDQKRKASDSTLFVENILAPLPPGKYKLSLQVSDILSGREASVQDEFVVVYSKSLKIDDLVFKSDGKQKSIVTFNVIGFKKKEGNILISEDLYVLDEAGEVVLSKPEILAVSEKWEGFDLLELQNDLEMPIAGKYTLKIVVNDRHSGEQATSMNPFNVE